MCDESAERRALRETVAALAQRHAQDFVHRAGEGGFPHDLWKALANGGYAGINVSEEYGGPGGSVADLAAVAEEVAAAGCPLMTLVVSPGVCAPLVARHGTAAQKRRWLPGIATGRSRMAFALTESEAGSNSHRIATRLRRAADGWILDGHKQFISGVDQAEALLVVARHEGPHADGFALVIVPTGTAGLSFVPIPTHVEVAEKQFLVRLDAVAVSPPQLVGPPGAPLRLLFDGLNPERVISAATCVGLARYCLDKAASYATARRVWSEPIGAHQGVAHPLAKAFVQLQAARQLTRHAARLLEQGHAAGVETNVAKVSAAEAAANALDVAIQTLGGSGLARESGLGRLWGLVRLYGVAPVTREMALNHIAQQALGLPKSY
jgi:alkylation response protein AidB-like acyl-CoA dehydrogenase